MNLTTPQLLADLQLAIKAQRELLDSFKVARKSNVTKVYMLLLVHGINRKAIGALSLYQHDHYDAAGPIIRSAISLYIDFLNTSKHDDYPLYLDYLSGNHWKKSLTAHQQSPDSPYSQAIADAAADHQLENLDNMIADQDQRLQKIKAKLSDKYYNGNKIDTSEYRKFKLANKLREYDGLYRMLSRNVHGNIDSLVGRLDEDMFWCWPPLPEKASKVEISLLLDVIIDSTLILSKEYRKKVAHIRQLRVKHAEVMNLM